MGTQTWAYTSADHPVTYLSNTYTPIENLQRSNPEQSQERALGQLTIQMPHDADIAALFIGYVPPQPIWVSVFTEHDGDSEFTTFWQGRVSSVVFENSIATLNCDPIDRMFKRLGLRQKFQPACNHYLYSTGCTIVKDLFLVNATVGAVSADTVTSGDIGAKPDDWFTAGYAERSNGDRRFITAHTGNTITLLQPFSHLTVGEVIKVYAGCKRDPATCQSKFSNIVNFGGFPLVPLKNPFKVGLK